MKQQKSNLKHRFLDNIYVYRSPMGKDKAILWAGKYRFFCAIGKNGITALKREGDGKTPIAKMRIIYGFQKPTRRIRARCRVPIKIIKADDGWCDAPDDRNYNRPVKLPYCASSETMQRQDELYNIGFVLDYNICPRRRNGGSAIFFHVAKPNYKGTQGCIAISERDMMRVLPLLSTRTLIHILP